MEFDKPVSPPSTFRLPVAQMRRVFEPHEVQRKLDGLAERDYDTLRATYQRMLERGPQRFQVKPS
ncbi:MAG TPA: AAA family ATPase, partial [Burkholderiaceae bacterium]|nr:AAA family ATPase [Burkholderiaceae bacterium]